MSGYNRSLTPICGLISDQRSPGSIRRCWAPTNSPRTQLSILFTEPPPPPTRARTRTRARAAQTTLYSSCESCQAVHTLVHPLSSLCYVQQNAILQREPSSSHQRSKSVRDQKNREKEKELERAHAEMQKGQSPQSSRQVCILPFILHPLITPHT